MVHESISKRFFNRNLHAIDATPARQHGELLRRHHANTASSCAGTTYEFMQGGGAPLVASATRLLSSGVPAAGVV